MDFTTSILFQILIFTVWMTFFTWLNYRLTSRMRQILKKNNELLDKLSAKIGSNYEIEPPGAGKEYYYDN